MNKSKFIKEAMEYNECDINFELSDGYEYEICSGDNYIGGYEGTWESSILGHVAYNSYKECVYETARYVYDDLNKAVNRISF